MDGHPALICGGDDCDDNDTSSYPGALDVCDGRDNNCDGKIDPPSPVLKLRRRSYLPAGRVHVHGRL